MAYRFWKTSSKENNFALPRSCCFAFLMDCNNSLFDMIFRVSVIRFQSSRLSTTDLGLPSGEVINSTFGISSCFNIEKPPCFPVFKYIRTKKWSQHGEGEENNDEDAMMTSMKIDTLIVNGVRLGNSVLSFFSLNSFETHGMLVLVLTVRSAGEQALQSLRGNDSYPSKRFEFEQIFVP